MKMRNANVESKLKKNKMKHKEEGKMGSFVFLFYVLFFFCIGLKMENREGLKRLENPNHQKEANKGRFKCQCQVTHFSFTDHCHLCFFYIYIYKKVFLYLFCNHQIPNNVANWYHISTII